MSDVLVLCYHAVSTQWEAPLSVLPERLDRQLRYLTGRGFRGATFSEAIERPTARRTVAITFDDAFESVKTLAFPILERWGVPGTVFIPTNFAGRDEPMSWPGIDQWIGGPHETEQRPLGWDGLRDLSRSGWELGSHTASHPRLTELDDHILAAELTNSKAACERELGIPCRSIAYPYGDVNTRVVEAARTAGYLYGATLPRRLNDAKPLAWPRVGIYHDDSYWRFRAKASQPVRSLRASAAGERLAQVIRNR